MSWRDTLSTAWDAVRSHRLRSALTMLGILIGISAVTLSVGMGQGAKADVQDQLDELGTNLLVVSPGSSTDSSGGVNSAPSRTMNRLAPLVSVTVPSRSSSSASSAPLRCASSRARMPFM